MELYLYIAGGVLAGIIVALKIIAPRTANKTDDKVLEALTKAEPLLPKPPAK